MLQARAGLLAGGGLAATGAGNQDLAATLAEIRDERSLWGGLVLLCGLALYDLTLGNFAWRVDAARFLTLVVGGSAILMCAATYVTAFRARRTG